MAQLAGRSGNLYLFTEGSVGVIIDSSINVIVASGSMDIMSASHEWEPVRGDEFQSDLADLGVLSMTASITASTGRMYTIPSGVKAEAKKSLEWHKKYNRGGTSVGLNTARTLAAGGQIGIHKVRHIAKYFPRHEVDKKGKGWSPKEDGFPSKGRIAWALWGGDAAWRWAQAIVEREDKKPVTAAGVYEFDKPNHYIELEDFEKSLKEQEVVAPEFLARVRLDGSGIDRLYKIDSDSHVYVWDDGDWDSLGFPSGDIWAYDRALDDPYDNVETSHLMIDPDSAIIIAAHLHECPFKNVTIDEIDSHESELAVEAVFAEDWDFVDQTITAAAPAGADTVPSSDNQYTGEERSQNASKQVRDATGKFTSMGAPVTVGGDPRGTGTVTAMNSANGTADVKLKNGQTVTVPGKILQPGSYTATIPGQPVQVEPVDVTGILGEPRMPVGKAGAQLPGTLPAMTDDSLKQVLGNFSAWVKSERDSFRANPSPKDVAVQGKNSTDIGDAGRAYEKKADAKFDTNPYGNPLLNKWLHEKDKRSGTNNAIWYSPVVPMRAAGDSQVAEPEKVTPAKPGQAPTQVTPENSDVAPIYLAVVDQDDPQAVLSLVSLVPSSNSSTKPATFVRKDGKWVPDAQTLADLQSATPPPVVPLDDATLQDVIKQVDEATAVTASLIMSVLFGPTLVAAGGADRNRGNAEKLREYWTHGEGAAKIRWGTGGDWKRCVRHLSKYLGVRAKGYCQLRHKDALGFYTSTHAKMDRKAKHAASAIEQFADLVAESQDAEATPAFTKVTENEMAQPIHDIIEEPDDSYDDDWEPDEEIVLFLKNLDQANDILFSLVAAGGIDRSHGDAEQLRRYWTIGEGGAKIKWGVEGDWKRCVRHLGKYLGIRAKGYCALRHKEMNGVWPGSQQEHHGHFSLKDFDEIYELRQLHAQVEDAFEQNGLIADGTVAESGSGFYIPLVIPEGQESGDGRIFKKDAITMRDLPLPLMWQIKTGAGHDGSVVVGRIDKMEHTEDGIANAYGVFDSGAFGREAERLVRNGFLRGVSADMDKFEAEEEVPTENSEGEIKKNKIVINKARVMGVTIVPKPAFQECTINLLDGEGNPQEDKMITDGVYVDEMDPTEASALVACGIVAGVAPTNPPKEWFNNPALKEPTPLTVTDDGRVFGHIAAWHVDHIGMAFGTRPPRSRSNYAYFHTGVVRTEDGSDVPVGQITLAGGHADITASAAEAVKHYDDTASAVIDCHAGEDAYGIWVAGALRPGCSPEQVRALRASAPSGDWRPIKGSLELVAVCQVNVPGFPVARARVASGQVMALVAAGASVLAKLKSDPVTELSTRLERLEKVETMSAMDEARARFNALKQELNIAPAVETLTADGMGMEAEEQEPLIVDVLEKLLSDVVSVYFRAHGYHWNVKGQDFAQYHELFSDIYEDIYGSIDPIAENIVKLGYDSPFNLGDFMAGRSIGDSDIDTANPHDMAYDLFIANNALIEELKMVFNVCTAANEQGIANFIAERIDHHQKWAWQLRASVIPEEFQTLSDEANEDEAEQFYAQAFSILADEGIIASGVPYDEAGYISEAVRAKAAEKGFALKDGSFPIRNASELKKAIHAYGRAKNKAAVRKHIIKRAEALGKSNLVPEGWTTASSQGITASVESMRARIEAITASAEGTTESE
jgi:DNA-binding ferritin-like protein